MKNKESTLRLLGNYADKGVTIVGGHIHLPDGPDLGPSLGLTIDAAQFGAPVSTFGSRDD